jgi:hypothetical protein
VELNAELQPAVFPSASHLLAKCAKRHLQLSPWIRLTISLFLLLLSANIFLLEILQQWPLHHKYFCVSCLCRKAFTLVFLPACLYHELQPPVHFS